MKALLLTTGVAMAATIGAALAEPMQLTADQMDRITAGAVTAVVVFAPNQPPQQTGCACINHFIAHPGASTATFVVSGEGAATLTPGGAHGNIEMPD